MFCMPEPQKKTPRPNWQRKVISFVLYWLIVSNSAWLSKYLWDPNIYGDDLEFTTKLNTILNINYLTNDISWDFYLIPNSTSENLVSYILDLRWLWHNCFKTLHCMQFWLQNCMMQRFTASDSMTSLVEHSDAQPTD